MFISSKEMYDRCQKNSRRLDKRVSIMSGIYELEEAIERQRCYMDALAEKGMQDEEFYRASVDLDHLIAQYVELEETLREKEYQD